MKGTCLPLGSAFAIAFISAGLALEAPAAAMQTRFFDPTPFAVPGVGTSGPASPYPGTILVSGLNDPVTKVTATIFGFSHTFPDDVGALLVSPTGLRTVLFNGAGSSIDAVNLTWTFDDDAAAPLPSSGALASGTCLPSNYYPGDNFPNAPSGPYPTAMSALLGGNPNGVWSLYVFDFVGGDSGSIRGGWSLTFTAAGNGVIPEPVSSGLMIAGFGLVGFVIRRRCAVATTA